MHCNADQPDACVPEKLKVYKGGGVLKAIHPIQVELLKLGLVSPVSPEGCQEPQVSLGTQEMEPTCNLHIWDSLSNKAFLMHLPFGDLQCQTILIKA